MAQTRSIVPLIFNKFLINVIGLVRGKILAVTGGVAAIGVLGQIIPFQNLQRILVMFGTPAVLVRYIGQDPSRAAQVERAVLSIVLSSTVFITSILLIFSKYISVLLFDTGQYQNYVSGVALLGPLYAIYWFMEVRAQAHKQFKRLVKGQAIAIGSALLAVVPLVYYMGIAGVIIDLGVWFAVGTIYYLPSSWRSLKLLPLDIDELKPLAQELLPNCLRVVLRNTLVFGSVIVLRIIIVHMMDLVNAGYFQAVWSIASYSEVFLRGFIVYLLPVISGIVVASKLRQSINYHFQILLHILLPLFLFISVFPEFILITLYSEPFATQAQNLSLIILGKYCEVTYLFYLSIFLGQGNYSDFLKLESIRSILYIALPAGFIAYFMLEGAIIAVLLTQLISLGSIVLLGYRKPEYRLDTQSTKMLIIGAIGIIGIALMPNNIWWRMLPAILCTAFALQPRRLLNFVKNFRQAK